MCSHTGLVHAGALDLACLGASPLNSATAGPTDLGCRSAAGNGMKGINSWGPFSTGQYGWCGKSCICSRDSWLLIQDTLIFSSRHGTFM